MRVEATGMPVFFTNSLSSRLASRHPPPTYSTGLRACKHHALHSSSQPFKAESVVSTPVTTTIMLTDNAVISDIFIKNVAVIVIITLAPLPIAAIQCVPRQYLTTDTKPQAPLRCAVPWHCLTTGIETQA